ncbi:MAG: efflux RND transporter periplasmic adaptor subunit [Xanthomonadales bacterium]|nr:efflux RND transporter periplasmic adaptor subunit [Xanthomonadales bacterium]ODU93404.1 MAG: efflux transporter periplasmic adaptor subunit [Rhodanobacter sp. SCN 66-43]OJY83162.1 MAG: efflux transporter periplasmic adaptor subunit [Xanthomonadales bacterium 66-474]
MSIRDTSAQDRIIEKRVSKKKLGVLAGIGVAVLLLLVWLLPGAIRLMGAGSSVSASRLQIATVERGDFVRDIAADGRVVAAVSPTLYARAGGAVVLKVHAGDKVAKDQVLAVIASPELTNKLAQEQNNEDAMQVAYEQAKIDANQQRSKLQEAFENAKIDAQSAKRDLARYQEAYQKGAVSKLDVDRHQDALEKAQIQMQHAQDNLGMDDSSLTLEIKAKKLAYDRQKLLVADVQRQVDELNVRSPVSGQVGQLFIAQTATVPKDAKLLTVVDLSALEVQVNVPESFARDLAAGMPAAISGNGNDWKGAVSAISPEVVNGEVVARVRFEGDKPKDLRQNQRLSVRIMLDKRDNVLTVARGSFVDESGGRYAYVVRDGIAYKTPVTLGPSSIDKVEILQGLKEGEKVVISGTDSFNGAAKVAISN